MKIYLVCRFSFFLGVFLTPFVCSSENIYNAMSKAYSNSPKLKAFRANLKATDESISKILSEKRPVVSVSGTVGTDKTTTTNTSNLESTTNNITKSINLELSQNLFDSGRVKFKLNKAENLVMAERAYLLAEEQKILFSTAEVYLKLFAAKELLKLKINNVKVLKQHLNATNDRYEVGEVTSTDLYQAEARYLQAKSDEIKSRGDVRVQESIYFAIIGEEAPKNLILPNKPPSLPKTLKDAFNIANKNNPNIVASSFKKKAALFDISSVASELLPSLDLNINAQNAWDPNTFFSEYQNYGIDLNLNVPLFNGGYNYSNIREKRNIAIKDSRLLEDTIRETLKEVEVVWLTLQNLNFGLKSINASVKANKVALEGVKEESIVGTRTTLDVLDAEQELLEEKVELINSQTSFLIQAYNLMEKTGSLNPDNLKLNVSKYDAIKNYNSVKNLWLGFEP